MIKRVLAAFDGSDLSREAFAYAVMLAEPAGLEVVGVHVLEPDPPALITGDPAMVDPTPLILEQERERAAQREWAEGELSEMEKACARRGIPFSSHIVSGPLLSELTEVATATDLIAVGKKGRFARAGIGSTTAALVKCSPCPVMVVSGPMRPVNRVLAVSDGSSVSKRAVAEGRSFAESAGWPLTLLAAAGHDHTLSEALDQAQQLAPEATVISLSEDEQRHEGELIEHAAGADQYALLFMGAYAESWLHRLFFGSTTSHVLAHLGSPVVLVR